MGWRFCDDQVVEVGEVLRCDFLCLVHLHVLGMSWAWSLCPYHPTPFGIGHDRQDETVMRRGLDF